MILSLKMRWAIEYHVAKASEAQTPGFVLNLEVQMDSKNAANCGQSWVPIFTVTMVTSHKSTSRER